MATEEGDPPADTEKADSEPDDASVQPESLFQTNVDPDIESHSCLLYSSKHELQLDGQARDFISKEDTLYEKKIGSSSEAQEIRSLICPGPTFDCDKFSRIVPRLAENAEGKLSTTINKASVDSLLHHFAVTQELATHVLSNVWHAPST